MSKKKINWPAALAIIVLPLLMITGVSNYCLEYSFGSKEAILAIIAYCISDISVGVGLHRLWSHGSFKTVKLVEFFLMLTSAGTLQGSILIWASDHKKHHSFADTDKDPYTPARYKENKLKGFLWAHMGWMLVSEINIDKLTVTTLGRKKMLLWQHKNYWKIASFMNIVPPIILGWCIFGNITLQSTLAGLFFVGIGRALQQQMTFCVNSVCHFIGSKKYANDSSGDIWWLFPLLFGENWHNFHHAFGRDYRNGHKWYHADVHKWIIYLLSKVGLAWDLVRTPNERIEARMVEMRSNLRNDWQKKLEDIEIIAGKLAVLAKQKVACLEKSASEVVDSMASKAKQKLSQLEESAARLAENVKTMIEHSEALSAKIVDEKLRQLNSLKKAAANIGLTISMK